MRPGHSEEEDEDSGIGWIFPAIQDHASIVGQRAEPFVGKAGGDGVLDQQERNRQAEQKLGRVARRHAPLATPVQGPEGERDVSDERAIEGCRPDRAAP